MKPGERVWKPGQLDSLSCVYDVVGLSSTCHVCCANFSHVIRLTIVYLMLQVRVGWPRGETKGSSAGEKLSFNEGKILH